MRSSLPTSSLVQSSARASHDHLDYYRESSHRESVTVSTNSQSPQVTTKDNRFLRIIHPTHDPEGNPTLQDDSPKDEEGAFLRKFDQSCRRLGCSSEQGWELIKIYFSHMTSSSLFHRPTFKQKLKGITSVRQLQALLSAIFSFALRYTEGVTSLEETIFSAKRMLDISTQLQHECIEECEDDDPPIHLLQSLYLVTFQKLIHGVRGKTWRMLGDCIRIAFELRLNMIDAKAMNSEAEINHIVDSQGWIQDEEKRRIWWSLWEMDVFTCVIRRLPSAIDERFNFTYLPVSDNDWYKGNEAPSCFLVSNATERWREVSASGNRSPQTWFILINSYMYDAFKMGAFPEIWATKIGFQLSGETSGNLLPKIRNLLDDCLRCAHMAMPEELNWQHRFLAFDMSGNIDSSRALDSARYSIHIMAQLSRLMLYVWEVHRIAASDQGAEKEAKTPPGQETPVIPAESTNADLGSELQVWERYVDAANLTADVIKNSTPLHYQYVNPLISNAIWYAAAAMVVVKLFGPERFKRRLAASNFDLIVATLNRYEAFWQIPSILKHKLRDLEDKFAQLKAQTTPAVGTQSPDVVPTDQQVLPAAISVPAPPPATETRYDQPTDTAIDNEQLASLYDYGGQDWTAQAFNFGDIPAFGAGQSDLVQANLFDPFFDNTGFVLNDALNFNDLFMYPYQ